METEIIESVLKEILEEQKASLQVNRELSTNIDNLTSKMEGVYQKLELQKAPLRTADTKLVQAIVSTGMRQIQQIVEARIPPVKCHNDGSKYYLFSAAQFCGNSSDTLLTG